MARFGYTFIWVDDVAATVAFLESAFGIQRRMLIDNPPHGAYAEMESGETTIAIADTKEAKAIADGGLRLFDLDDKPFPFQLSFVDDDVHAVFERAIAAGASVMMQPETKPWGQTIGRLRAPAGFLVSVTSPMAPMPPSKGNPG